METREWLTAVVGYALGSVLPAEILAWRRLRTSMRSLGDNPGGAGAWRKLGPSAAVVVASFDVAKGAVVAWLARRVATSLEGFVLVCVSPVAGHNWPVHLLFRGGRGLAPAAGVLLVLATGPAVVSLGLGALLALRTRWAPTVGIVGLPLYVALLVAWQYPPREVAAAIAVTLTVAVRQLPWVWERLREVKRRFSACA
ncbi:MAG: glycerol-3-phosphate acyltransferase [Firmicutes bacterium]|nr:glycerol-3-phosphate acyltransferase [Bacillota bacterium]